MINIITASNLVCSTNEIIDSEVKKRGQEVIFVVPEYAKASIEKLTIDAVKKYFSGKDIKVDNTIVSTSLVNGDVLSFMRLAGRLLETAGRPLSGAGDNTLMRNAIYSVLYNHDAEFTTINKLKFRYEYIDMLIDLLGDFYRYGITEEKVDEVIDELSGEDEIFLNKLKDIRYLMSHLSELGDKYGLVLNKGPIDGASKLLSEVISSEASDDLLLRRASEFVRRKFAVIGFGTVRLLTPQEINFVKLLSDCGAEINFYLTSSGSDNGRIYENGNTTLRMLCECGAAYNVVPFGIDIPQNDISRVATSYALGLPCPEKLPESELTDSIISVDIKSRDDRIAYVANEIIRLTREEGYRYKDIRIVSVDDDLVPRFRNVMKNFGLDIFIDEVFSLNNSPVIRYTECLLLLPLTNYSTEIFLKLMRTGVAGILPDDADLFENFCVEHNLMWDERIFDEENYRDTRGEFYRNGKNYNTGYHLYKFVVERVLCSVRETAQEIYNAELLTEKAALLGRAIEKIGKEILRHQIREMSQTGRSDEAKTIAAGYRELLTLLASFTSEMNSVKITQQQFLDLIKIDMKNKAVSSIPLKVDSIEIETPSQALITNCKVMFVLGEKSDNFPYRASADGIMTNDEMSRFSEKLQGINLPDKRASRTRTDFITSALMFTSVTDKLYFVHEDGAQNSTVYNYFRAHGRIHKRECFRNPIIGEAVIPNEDLSEGKISKEHIKELIGDELKISVTSLEKYNECHLRYMLSSMLKIKERIDNTKVKVNGIGTITHKMYEVIFSELKEKYGTVSALKQLSETMTDSDLDLLVNNAYEEYKKTDKIALRDSARFDKNPGLNVKRIVRWSFPLLLREIVEKGFVPDSFEVDLGKENLTYNSGDVRVKFRGLIDRIDRREEDGAFRIIDYKTGSKDIDYDFLYNGLQIQVPLYISAFEKSGKGVVVDGGYIESNIKPGNKDSSPDPSPKLYGLDEEKLKAICRYAEDVMYESTDKIVSGLSDSQIHDCIKTHCDFCPYSVICGRNRRVRPKKEYVSKEKLDSKGKELGIRVTSNGMKAMTSIFYLDSNEDENNEQN